MPCTYCKSERQVQFGTEIAIHSKDLIKPHTFIFPEIFVCLNCGKPEFAAEFRVKDTELDMLVSRDTARSLGPDPTN